MRVQKAAMEKASEDGRANRLIWHGMTPAGMNLVVERDSARCRWVVTVAGCSRGRRDSLSDALHDACGGTIGDEWLEALARRLEERVECAPRSGTRRRSRSRAGRQLKR